MRWRSVPQNEFLWAEWDGEYVLYHRSSGQTHFVNAATAELLQRILLEPAGAEAASRALAASRAPETPADPQFTDYVFGLLVRLETLGLIVRVPA